MPATPEQSPAERAASIALSEMFECLDQEKGFRFEAGAGAGKTYSLVEAIKKLVAEKAPSLRASGGRIGCITYTNAARDEILARAGASPVLFIETIHAFCWFCIRQFQPALRETLANLDSWPEKWGTEEVIGNRHVAYDQGRRRIDDRCIWLHHDDVPALFAELLETEKFQRIVSALFPLILIDEYQDTNRFFVEAVKAAFLDRSRGPLIGLFGDHWQQIYEGESYGLLEHENLKEIPKRANFRSAPAIVAVLNRLRPELPQEVSDPTAPGEVVVFHANEWSGERQTGPHTKGDVSEEASNAYFGEVQARLADRNWPIDGAHFRILMLTHSLLAKMQGYPSIPRIFSSNDGFVKKEDAIISFLVDRVEPAYEAFEARKFGSMLRVFGQGGSTVQSQEGKRGWSELMKELGELRANGSVGDVLDLMLGSPAVQADGAIKQRNLDALNGSPEQADPPPAAKRTFELRNVPYTEIIALARFIEGHTPFSTKHGVKGLEFNSVLAVLGRGWSKYDFGGFLDWSQAGNCPRDKEAIFRRTRNLFYVVCSRAQRNLALLITQKLSSGALAKLESCFGRENVVALPDLQT